MTARKRKATESFAEYRADLRREAWVMQGLLSGVYKHVSVRPDFKPWTGKKGGDRGEGVTYRKPK